MFTKFAAFEVLSAVMVPEGSSVAQGDTLVRTAHRAVFDYEVRPGFLYVRSRAISSRCNDNFDEFPAEEIKAAYKTFVGKPVFVNHHNDNHRRARGVIIDAVLHEDKNPDGSPDTWAEVLMEVDAVRFPKLAKAIIKRKIERTSMGTDVAHSICSVCGNKATTPAEYCVHIPRMKGQRIYKSDHKTGAKEGVLVREICYGLGFFENSLLVEEPADPTAFFTGVDERGLGKAAAKTAAEQYECHQCGKKFDTTREVDQHGQNCTDSRSERAEREGWGSPGSDKDAWGQPKKQPGDGHGAWDCNNYQCTEHPEEMYGRGAKDGELAQGMPGWLEHDTRTPAERSARENVEDVFKQPHLEDANWALNQQPHGPSKFSLLDHFGTLNPDPDPVRDEQTDVTDSIDNTWVTPMQMHAGLFRHFASSEVTDADRKNHAALLDPENGGFTHHPQRGDIEAPGYVVSDHADSHTPSTSMTVRDADLTPEKVAEHRRTLETGGHLDADNAFQGGWRENGSTDLDLSHQYNSHQGAYHKGLAEKQKAYFDLGTFKSMYYDKARDPDLASDPHKYDERDKWAPHTPQAYHDYEHTLDWNEKKEALLQHFASDDEVSHGAIGRGGSVPKEDDPWEIKEGADTEPIDHVLQGARDYVKANSRSLGRDDIDHSGLDKVKTNPTQVEHIANQYDRMPAHDWKAIPHYTALREEVNAQHDHLTGPMGISVEPVSHDPYRDVHEMAADMRDNKRLKVMKTTDDQKHPFFTHEENDKFRAVHDAFGHAATGRGFDRHGEEAAYRAHRQMFSAKAHPALATETRGQNSYLIHNGHFGPQKLGILPERMRGDSDYEPLKITPPESGTPNYPTNFKVRRSSALEEHFATWIGDHPDDPTLFWEGEGGHQVHIKNIQASDDSNAYQRVFHTPPNTRPALKDFQDLSRGEDGTIHGWREHTPGFGVPPESVQKHIHRAFDAVAENRDNHRELFNQLHLLDRTTIQDHDSRDPRNKRPFESSLQATAHGDHEDTQAGPDGQEHFHVNLDPATHDFLKQVHEDGQRRSEMHEHADKRTVDTSDQHDLKSHMMEAHQWSPDDYDFHRNTHGDHPALGEAEDEDREMSHDEVRKMHDWEHQAYTDWPGATTLGSSHFHTAGLTSEAYKPKKLVRNMNEDELAEHKEKVAKSKAEGQKWNRRNPVKIKNVVAHWDAATDDEKKAGENWYSDAHNLAHHIANDTGHSHSTVAGLVSIYSPQTHWAQNIQTAARVARTREPLGGQGSGVMASNNQKKQAERVLNGEHHSQVLGGPKTKAFAHLIEHGGSEDEEHDPQVVIDRHALSVAAGARATDSAYAESRLGTKGRYHQVAQTYHKAAKQISKQEGRTIHAHQVQAATWLTRQRLNEEADRTNSATDSSSATTQARGAVAKWNDYAAEHHPGLLGKEPGTGYSRAVSSDEPEDVQHASDMASEGKTITKASSLEDSMERTAYGETKAPADVDTLRDEACPICGEGASYDGNQCQVCGYVSPPRPFQDPDVDMAKSLDLRKEVDESQGGDGEIGTGLGEDGNPVEEDPNAPLDPEALADPDVDPAEQQEQDPLDPNALNGEDATVNVDVKTLDDPQSMEEGAPLDQQDQIGRTSPELEQNYMREGEPFTPGPNAPNPEQPMEPLDPASDELEEEENNGMLGCPACGLTVPAAHPISQGDATDVATDDGEGLTSGTPCPNCGKAPLEPAGTV